MDLLLLWICVAVGLTWDANVNMSVCNSSCSLQPSNWVENRTVNSTDDLFVYSTSAIVVEFKSLLARSLHLGAVVGFDVVVEGEAVDLELSTLAIESGGDLTVTSSITSTAIQVEGVLMLRNCTVTGDMWNIGNVTASGHNILNGSSTHSHARVLLNDAASVMLASGVHQFANNSHVSGGRVSVAPAASLQCADTDLSTLLDVSGRLVIANNCTLETVVSSDSVDVVEGSAVIHVLDARGVVHVAVGSELRLSGGHIHKIQGRLEGRGHVHVGGNVTLTQQGDGAIVALGSITLSPWTTVTLGSLSVGALHVRGPVMIANDVFLNEEGGSAIVEGDLHVGALSLVNSRLVLMGSVLSGDAVLSVSSGSHVELVASEVGLPVLLSGRLSFHGDTSVPVLTLTGGVLWGQGGSLSTGPISLEEEDAILGYGRVDADVRVSGGLIRADGPSNEDRLDFRGILDLERDGTVSFNISNRWRDSLETNEINVDHEVSFGGTLELLLASVPSNRQSITLFQYTRHSGRFDDVWLVVEGFDHPTYNGQDEGDDNNQPPLRYELNYRDDELNIKLEPVVERDVPLSPPGQAWNTNEEGSGAISEVASVAIGVVAGIVVLGASIAVVVGYHLHRMKARRKSVLTDMSLHSDFQRELLD